VLVNNGVFVNRQRSIEAQARLRALLPQRDGEPLPNGTVDLLALARDVLEWPDGLLAGAPGGPSLPDRLTVPIPEHEDTLSPSFALPQPGKRGEWMALISTVPDLQDLDRPAGDRGWRASPHARLGRGGEETNKTTPSRTTSEARLAGPAAQRLTRGLSDGPIQTGIQRESFLRFQLVSSGRTRGVEQKVPAFARDGTRNNDERVMLEQRAPERLLSAARRPGRQPSGVGDVAGHYHMDVRGAEDPRTCQDVRHGVERREALVNRDFQDGGCRVRRTVDHGISHRIPSSANLSRARAAVPRRTVSVEVEAPRDRRPRHPRQGHHT
jgi:hypothetical protein